MSSPCRPWEGRTLRGHRILTVEECPDGDVRYLRDVLDGHLLQAPLGDQAEGRRPQRLVGLQLLTIAPSKVYGRHVLNLRRCCSHCNFTDRAATARLRAVSRRGRPKRPTGRDARPALGVIPW